MAQTSTADFHSIEADGISVTLDLRGGHIRDLSIEREGRTIKPLHTAPWVDDPEIAEDEGIEPNLRFLSGDFYCAPFGASDIDLAPPHGWTGNSRWQHVETVKFDGGVSARYRLERLVMGAAVEKIFVLRNGHPFLYQTHRFTGGVGALPVANHAMVRMPAGGRISFSAKAWVETPTGSREPHVGPGGPRLRYPARSCTLTLPMADGGTADLTDYPFAQGHEDLAMLVEQPDNALGWAAVLKRDTQSVFLTLKNPRDYPVTILWFSNGGRFARPWNGRHVGVLGIEEGRTYFASGHRASISPNPLSAAGRPTALELSPTGSVDMRNVIGAAAAGSAAAVTMVEARKDSLAVSFDAGPSPSLPYDSSFLAGQ
jgi:hypothetical protein